MPMILRAFLFAAFICLAAHPAQADNWFWNAKKKEAPVPGEQPKPPKVFNNPGDVEGAPEKKWVLDKIMNPNQSTKPQDVVVNGVKIIGLTPEMLTAGYAPKSVEEIGAIMHAQNAWQDASLEQLEADAQARIAAANKKSAEGLKALAAADAKSVKHAHPDPEMQNQQVEPEPQAEQPPVKQIFNKPTLDKPSKVFKDYR